MRIPLGYKFLLGFLVVVAVVASTSQFIRHLDYAPEMGVILTYVVALTVGMILGALFSRSFTKKISRLTSSADAISRGDLTIEVNPAPGRFPDEIHDISVSINSMAESLRQLVGHIRNTSEKVSESAQTLSSTALEINASTEEVAQTIEQISRGAETQAEMVSKSSKTIHEMAISVELIARKAKDTSRAARETSITAQRGGDLAKDSLERMKGLLDNVEATGKQFLELNSRLQQVGKIADFIGEIARQTNMLALNASIEAARAGEYGKGFAVVADEVRKLADGAGKSATDILELIGLIKESSQLVYGTITHTTQQISEGKKNIDNTASSFTEILNTVIETERKANSIADLSAMQTEGAEKMVQAIDEIARVAEDNAASTEEVSAATEEQSAAMQEMAAAARELASLSEELLQIVARFRISVESETVV